MARPRKGEARPFRDARWPRTFHASRNPIIVEGVWLYVHCNRCDDQLLYDGTFFPYVITDDGSVCLGSTCNRCLYIAAMLAPSGDSGPMDDRFKWMKLTC